MLVKFAVRERTNHSLPPPGELIVCRNGILHLRGYKLWPPTPAYFTSTASPVAWDVDAPEPVRWLDFLASQWADDPAQIICLRQWMFYLLTQSTDRQKMVLFVGPRRSGKSTIAWVIEQLCGPENVAGPTLAMLGSQFGTSSLIGRTVAIVPEPRTQSDHRIDVGEVVTRLLQISGQDRVAVDVKNSAIWSGRLDCRIMFLTNSLPSLPDMTGALAARFVFLHHRRSFEGHEDLTLRAALSTELPSILKWAAGGFEDFREHGDFVQSERALAVAREMRDLSGDIRNFIDDCCITGERGEVPCAVLYQRYRTWCERTGSGDPVNVKSFGRKLRSRLTDLTRVQRGHQWTYVGLRLRPEWAESEPLI